ncbi:hypothetical protein THRCLA_06171 [Thraustotheca clavata]|uniref:Cyclic nucleotide-binding domain-containing protein n=1 Tax=Thraustotheca clavata TaxID=74557 RepID=A0A1V9ZQW6_9STRA|nr:hypothetical protein THRCLA_06171 [Thraustotheca clavata]
MAREAAIARWKKIQCLLSCIRTFTHHGDVGIKASNREAIIVPFTPSTWSLAKRHLFERAYNKLREYRTDADLKLLMELIQSLVIFAHLSYASKIYLCWNLQCQELHDGEVVYHQGERITPFAAVYIVLEGVISLYQNPDAVEVITDIDDESYDVSKLGDCIKTVSIGEYFGQTALQGIVLRQYTVLAQSRAKIAMITQAEYLKILEHENPRFNVAEYLYPVQCEPNKRTLDDTAKLCDLLSTFQLFRCLPLPAIEKLSSRLIIQTFYPDDTILLQEETIGKFIVVVSGRVQLHIANTTELYKLESESIITTISYKDAEDLYGPGLCEFAHGEFFGEQAFDRDYGAVQSGTLRAISPVATIVLMRSDYEQIIQEEWSNSDTDRTSTDKEAELAKLLAIRTHERSELHIKRTISCLVRSEARVFLSQFSSKAMQLIAEHATLRSVNAGDVLLEQNHSESMFILLNGSVNIHRLTARKKSRKESNIIRVKLHGVVETSMGFGADIYDKYGQFLGSLGPGGTFGHVPILTKSHCQSTYIVSRNLNKGIVTATVLVIPSQFVNGLLQHQDEFILYNPRMIIENASLKPKDAMNATLEKFSNYLKHNELLRAIPTSVILRLLQGMEVVDIKNNQLLWEEQECSPNAIVIVLSGSFLLLHSGRKLPLIGSPTLRDSEQHLFSINPNRTAEKITRMNSTDTTTMLSVGDCVGTLKISKEERFTRQSHSAIALSDGKVGIIQWGTVQSQSPSVLKLAEDIEHLRHLQIRDEIERVTINRLTAPKLSVYGSEENKKLIAQILVAAGWKDNIAEEGVFESIADTNRDRIGQIEAVLGPGDIMGECALFAPGITCSSTAVAATPVLVLKLHKDAYSHLVKHGHQDHSSSLSARNQSERAREHWKLAVQFVLKKRSQRSQWPCVIEFAKQKRIRLVMDLIKDVPSFAGMTSEFRKKICERTLFQTYSANSYVFAKGRPIERFYVIISGSVDLIQSSGNGIIDSNIAPLAASTSDASELAGYTKVRTVSDGEWFGEYEILAGKDSRLISAVTPNGVRLVAVNKAEFQQSWPTKAAMLARLNFITSIDAIKNLDEDRLCSLWYGLVAKVYRLNETIIPYPSNTKTGTEDALYIVEVGQCTLRHQIPITRRIKCKTWQEPNVELETQIALLDCGSALLCEESTWRMQRLVASTHKATILLLHYPNMPFMIQRLLGKRGVGTLRKLMRLQFEWQELQEQAATNLAVTAHPKPCDATILPCVKCVPTATIQGNRMALPRFLMHRELTPSVKIEVKVDGPRLPVVPPKPANSSQTRPILGSFLFKPKAVDRSALSGPVLALPAKSPTDMKIIRLERQLHDQIQIENQLAHALDHSERLKLSRQAGMDAKLRLKHGRPARNFTYCTGNLSNVASIVATDQRAREKRQSRNGNLRVFKAAPSTSTRTS